MKYTPEIGTEICQLIAADHTLDQIEKLVSVNRRDIYEWIRANDQFRTDIAHAREAQADAIAENIRIIAARVQNGDLLPEQGKVAANLMQWLAAKRKPKTYGDKMTLAGDAENPLFNLGKRMDALRERREQRQLAAPIVESTAIEVHPGEQFA